MSLPIIAFAVVLCALIIIAVTLRLLAPKPSRRRVEEVKTIVSDIIEIVEEVIEPVAPIEVKPMSHLEKLWKDSSTSLEDPSVSFPTLTGRDEDQDVGNSYSYENLQKSHLESGSGSSYSRNGQQTRPAWSRFGERTNPEKWQKDMESIKKEIEVSGLTLEQFAETSLVPIPEQMAAYWKNAEKLSLPEPSRDTVSAKKSEMNESAPSKFALQEASALAVDAVQKIFPGASDAMKKVSMDSIYAARKQASTWGVAVPELDEVTKATLASLAHTESELSFKAKEILSM